MTPANDASIGLPAPVHSLTEWGGKTISEHPTHELLRMIPHPRTLRKARENVKSMVNTGVSLRKTKNYLHHFVIWWVKTTGLWTYEELLELFIRACWEPQSAAIATELLQRHFTISRMQSSVVDGLPAA